MSIQISSVSISPSESKVRVTFNTPMTDNVALRNTGNYSITGGSGSVTISSVTPEPVAQPTYVDLTTSEFTNDVTYTLNVYTISAGDQTVSLTTAFAGSNTFYSYTASQDLVLPVTDNLIFWLDASEIDGLNNGDGVPVWEDMSGNDFDFSQGSTSEQPLYRTGIQNGLPGVSFDESGSGDVLSMGADKTNVRTVFLVAKWAGANDRDYVPMFGNSPGGGTLYFHGTETTDGPGRWFHSTFTDGSITGGSAWQDGTGVSPLEIYRFRTDTTIFAVRTTSNVTLRSTGLQDGFSTRNYRGYWFEAIAYSAALSNDEVLEIIEYLNEKWSVY